ncbi:hypothetical protein [Azospirillum halopraeferens]|uniref:hypothetical protein n=1 Tax=Azospirillum halopraeferens TaxID=34010 RepID=UPI000415B6D2|nr:hypothetical protein [Azospirillum halopraeferens]
MIRLEGTIAHLEDVCPVEEAEELLEMLQGHAVTALHLGACTALHTAVFQLVRASCLPVMSAPADPILASLLPVAEPHHVCVG